MNKKLLLSFVLAAAMTGCINDSDVDVYKRQVLQTAMNDSYELIRRYAVEYVEKNCNPELLPAWIESRSEEHTSELQSLSRISYATSSIGLALSISRSTAM